VLSVVRLPGMKDSPDKTCEVHLWKYHLPDPVPEISMNWFSMEEKEAIAKRGKYEDRVRFFRVHAFLKKALGQYTFLPPEQIHLAKGVYGKPFINCDHVHPPFFFSLSYRLNHALLAISNEIYVGVDVEKVEEIDDFFPFLLNHFAANERKIILAAESGQRQQSLLYTLWTMKEAVVKSLAIGLPRKLNKYDLSFFLDEPFGAQKFDPLHVWRIETIPVGESYKAAIALRARNVNIQSFEYSKDFKMMGAIKA